MGRVALSPSRSDWRRFLAPGVIRCYSRERGLVEGPPRILRGGYEREGGGGERERQEARSPPPTTREDDEEPGAAA